jgi:hypothetical protein
MQQKLQLFSSHKKRGIESPKEVLGMALSKRLGIWVFCGKKI